MCFSDFLSLVRRWLRTGHRRHLHKAWKTKAKESSHVFAHRSSARSCIAAAPAHKVITDLLAHFVLELQLHQQLLQFPLDFLLQFLPILVHVYVQLLNQVCLLLAQITGITETAGLKVVRDSCRFQFIIMQSNSSSSWFLFNPTSHASAVPNFLTVVFRWNTRYRRNSLTSSVWPAVRSSSYNESFILVMHRVQTQ